MVGIYARNKDNILLLYLQYYIENIGVTKTICIRIVRRWEGKNN